MSRRRAARENRPVAPPPPRAGGGPGRAERFWAGMRPLDPLRSVKAKLNLVVLISVCISTLMVVLALNSSTPFRVVMVFSVIASLLVTQFLAHSMTSGLRQMTAAARAMAEGDYTRRVHIRSQDEVGELALAFNTMAGDLEASDRQRRELIANVSHELRTPIAALRAVLENVVDGVVTPEPATMAAALEQTERLGRLVAHLLDLSKLADGADSLELRPFEVEPFLAGVLRGLTVDGSVSGGASKRRTDVALALDVAPGLTATADAERLHQVVANLVDNACRHSPVDGTVTVRARASDDGGLLVDVADEGPGIAPEDRGRVFERFGRGSGATAQGGPGSDGGTGLGLAIARWAVELHHGTIAVADSPLGCLIRVSLPGPRRPQAFISHQRS